MSREIKEDLLEGFGNEGMDVGLIAGTDWVCLEGVVENNVEKRNTIRCDVSALLFPCVHAYHTNPENPVARITQFLRHKARGATSASLLAETLSLYSVAK